MADPLVPSSYKKLVSDITALYEGARRALVEAYWKIGERIVRVEQKGEIKAAYGAGLLPKLSEELSEKLGSGFSLSNLKRMRQFYLVSSKSPPSGQLTWSQYAELLPLENAGRRKQLIRKAVEKELDCKTLRKLVRAELVRDGTAGAPTPAPETGSQKGTGLLKEPKAGRVNTYRIKDANETVWPVKDVLLFDHGFKSYRAVTAQESRGLRAGDIVEWTGENLRKTNRTEKNLYTYKAYLEKVIDADTFWVMLDIGMREIGRQKLRLRGIDCPEIDTKEGLAAKKFLESVLKDIPSLTVLSSKNATYDRYEADVWFLDKTGREVYLNNLLLVEGYAVVTV